MILKGKHKNYTKPIYIAYRLTSMRDIVKVNLSHNYQISYTKYIRVGNIHTMVEAFCRNEMKGMAIHRFLFAYILHLNNKKDSPHKSKPDRDNIKTFVFFQTTFHFKIN